MANSAGITIAVLEDKLLLIGVPGEMPSGAARQLQEFIRQQLPDYRPVVIGNGKVIDLRKIIDADDEVRRIVARLQEIMVETPDASEGAVLIGKRRADG